jgi:outer membrane protein assembly factor BamD
MKNIILLILASLILTSCASDDVADEKPVLIGESYNQALEDLHKKSYEDAIKNFELVERDHPYSEWAVNSQIMQIYTHYKKEDYISAVAAAENFIQLHPLHQYVTYAYYLRAISYYDQIADVSHDQDITNKALSALSEVVTKFPNTPYAKDAAVKIELANDHLAGKEMTIGRFYAKRGQLVSAINRFKTVIDNYQTTSHTPEALYRLTEIYYNLGEKKEAQKYASILGYNYPNNKWYLRSYDLLEGTNLEPKKPWYRKII